MLFRELMQGSWQNTSCKDLAQETWWREQRSCSGIFSREFERRSCFEILYRNLLCISLLDNLYKQPYKGILHSSFMQLLHRTCQRDLAHDLLQNSSQRQLAESNLVSQYFFMFLATLLGVSCRDNELRSYWVKLVNIGRRHSCLSEQRAAKCCQQTPSAAGFPDASLA
jgi:hypothetical protein